MVANSCQKSLLAAMTFSNDLLGLLYCTVSSERERVSMDMRTAFMDNLDRHRMVIPIIGLKSK